jgi:hypothetical protein
VVAIFMHMCLGSLLWSLLPPPPPVAEWLVLSNIQLSRAMQKLHLGMAAVIFLLWTQLTQGPPPGPVSHM